MPHHKLGACAESSRVAATRPSLVVGPFDVEKLVAELRSASFDVAGLWIYRN
jgi:hypothetical protein